MLMVSGAPWQPLQPLPLPASARCQPEELPWEGWEAVSAMLSQMWLAQLLTYFLSWMSLQPLLRRLPSQHLRKMINGRVTGRHLAFGLALALLLGFLTAPVGRGHLLPSASPVLHGELRAVQHLAASRSLGGVAGLFLLVGVVAPTFEELLFRGFLLIALRRSSSPIFLSSFLFSGDILVCITNCENQCDDNIKQRRIFLHISYRHQQLYLGECKRYTPQAG